MRRVWTTEDERVIRIHIPVMSYGEASRHWQRQLSGARRARFGRIFLQRFGATQRRKFHLWSLRDYVMGVGLDRDEAPGAMFIWDRPVEAEVALVSSSDNRRLGAHMKDALRRFKQVGPEVLYEVEFVFE